MARIFNGKQGKGAMKFHRAVLRDEAEERNARTAPEKRRAKREGEPGSQQRRKALEERQARRRG